MQSLSFSSSSSSTSSVQRPPQDDHSCDGRLIDSVQRQVFGFPPRRPRNYLCSSRSRSGRADSYAASLVISDRGISSLTGMVQCSSSSVKMCATKPLRRRRQMRLFERGHFSGFAFSVICAIVLFLAIRVDHGAEAMAVFASCPSSRHLNSLLDTKGAKGAGDKSSNYFCDCTPDPTPTTIGWEINCMSRASEMPQAPSAETASDYYTLDANPLAFNIRYVQGKLIEITCDQSSPDFKPAMFQGFGVDEVDSFSFVNCPLPTLPLSVILHRTSIQPYISSNWPQGLGDGNQGTNDNEHGNRNSAATPSSSSTSSHQARDLVSQVRSLKIDSSQPVKVNTTRLAMLFNGLETLERLRLVNVIIETESPEQSHSKDATQSGPRRQRRAVTVSSATTAGDISNSGFGATLRQTFPSSTGSSATGGVPAPGTVPLPGQDVKPRTSSGTTPLPKPRGNTDSLLAPVTESATRASEMPTTLVEATETPTSPAAADTDDLMDPLGAREKMRSEMGGETQTPAASSRSVESVSAAPGGMGHQQQEPVRLNFSFVQFFPRLKYLVLEGIFPESKATPGNGQQEQQQPQLTHPGQLLKELIQDLRSLENIDLRKNHLPTILDNSFISSAASLKRLYLIGNGIRQMAPLSLANLNQLEILDLFSNQLTMVPERLLADLTRLVQLRLGQNLFTSLPEKMFAFNPSLKALDLNLNRNLTGLPDNLLSGLENLQNFTLNDCNLRRLSPSPESFFGVAPALERIEMRGNRFQNMTAHHMLGRNSRLAKVDLSYNDISQLSPNIFSASSHSLQELNLHGNELTALEPTSFYHLKNLRVLRLGFNNLTILPSELLFNLRQLEELDLRRNMLLSVNPEKTLLPFGLTAQLRVINLSHNNLSDFNEFTIINWSLYLRITDVILSHNKLRGEAVIPWFISTSPRVVLDLSNNELSTINVSQVLFSETVGASFAHDDRLRSEDMPSSSVTEVIVRLDFNPLVCDCKLEPFLSYANRTSNDLKSALRGRANKVSFDFYSPNLRCNGPDNSPLSGSPLNKVDFASLSCEIDDPRTCPRGCRCSYRAHDGHATVDCENSGLKVLPQSLVTLVSYRNVSLANSKATVHKVKGVTLRLGHNRISDIAPLNRLVSEAASLEERRTQKTTATPFFVELFLDNNAIKQIPEDFLLVADNEEENDESDEKELENGSDKKRKARVSPASSIVRLLSLRNNLIAQMPAEFLRRFDAKSLLSSQNGTKLEQSAHLSKSIKFFLGGNPYNCTPERLAVPGEEESPCQIMNFKSWLSSNYPIVGDIDDINCRGLANTSGSLGSNQDVNRVPLLEIPDNVLCPQLSLADQQALLTLTIACVVLATLLLIVSIMYYRNKQTVLAFVYIHLNPIFVCLHFNETDLDEDKLYDAFLSYSSADRDVVMELIEKLEKPSDLSHNSINFLQQQLNLPSVHEGIYDRIVPELSHPDLKGGSGTNKQGDGQGKKDDTDFYDLCIHERDWLPGNLISWNIVNSVQNSRRTVLILSKEFIQSIWFQVEFHTAYYQMLEDKMDRLIVVVKGELPPKEELDKDLVFLLTTKTYLVWGEKWFWEKLRYALPHKRKLAAPKVMMNNKAANVVNGGSGAGNNGTLSHAGKAGKMSKADIMKEYVDQTIANHFQLQSPAMSPVKPASASSAAGSDGQDAKTMYKVNSQDTNSANTTTEAAANNKLNRSSGRSKSNKKQAASQGHVNDSFVIETET